MLPILAEKSVIPDHQFGFRAEHGTIEQVHRVYETVRKSLEDKEYCCSAFLDIKQAFDKVWHRGLLYKIKMWLPHTFFELLKSYLSNRIFQVREGESTSKFFDILAGVPQGSVLGPVLYTIFTADLPEMPGITTATYADDTAVLASHSNPNMASARVQKSLNEIQRWLKKWRINVSTNKSVQVTFTLRQGNCPSIRLGEEELPHKDIVKYLGMHLDRRLTWRHHIQSKRDQVNLKMRKLLWLLGRNSVLSTDNKLLVYKSVLKPVWTYGIQLWGSSAASNINILQRMQNSILKTISNAPWFIKNTEVHEHLKVRTIKEEVALYSKRYRERLETHPNCLATSLAKPAHKKRLKRRAIMDLTSDNSN